MAAQKPRHDLRFRHYGAEALEQLGVIGASPRGQSPIYRLEGFAPLFLRRLYVDDAEQGEKPVPAGRKGIQDPCCECIPVDHDFAPFSIGSRSTTRPRLSTAARLGSLSRR